jgi:8-oxo-dGTP diphosphatase
METKRKAFAYITKGSKLLVFEQPDSPEAGIQVPAGTLEEGESPEVGVMREAWEETDLSGLKLCCFLGEQIRDMSEFGKQEIHHRFFYHLLCEDAPESWSHGEYAPSDEPEHDRGILRHRFDLYWVDLAEVPELIAEHGYFISSLKVHQAKEDEA